MKRVRQRGFTLVELLLVIIVGSVLAVGAFTLYTKQIRPGQYQKEKLNAFTYLVSGLEQARAYNGNAYPSAPQPISLLIPENPQTIVEQILASAIGKNNSNYGGWTYQCSNNTLTIRINLADTNDPDLRAAVRNAIIQNFGDWNCGPLQGDGTFTCSKNNVACR